VPILAARRKGHAPRCSCRRYHLRAGAVQQRAIWQEAVVAVVRDQVARIAYTPLHNAALQEPECASSRACNDCNGDHSQGCMHQCMLWCPWELHTDGHNTDSAKHVEQSKLIMAASCYLDVRVPADINAVIAHVWSVQVHVAPPTPTQRLQHKHPRWPKRHSVQQAA
jgi:hypothetical protein